MTRKRLHVPWFDEDGYKREPLLANPDGLDDTETPWQYIPSRDHQDLKNKMVVAVKSMSGRKHEVWTLLLQGKSLSEIADILNTTKSTANTFYRRGVIEIRKLVEM